MLMKTVAAAHSNFWQLGMNLYAQDGIKELCLKLQNQCGCDVNIVLLLTILEAMGLTPTADSLNALKASADEWLDDVLAPMRSGRTGISDQTQKEALYDIVKNLELIAEQAAHSDLFNQLELVPISSKIHPQLPHYIQQQAKGRPVPDLSGLRETAARTVHLS